eukprot:ctg_4055.g416
MAVDGAAVVDADGDAVVLVDAAAPRARASGCPPPNWDASLSGAETAGRGAEDHAHPEADARRAAHPLQGHRGGRRLQRPHRTGREERQGGGHGDSRRHDRRQAGGGAGAARLLGQPPRPAPHRALQ